MSFLSCFQVISQSGEELIVGAGFPGRDSASESFSCTIATLAVEIYLFFNDELKKLSPIYQNRNHFLWAPHMICNPGFYSVRDA